MLRAKCKVILFDGFFLHYSRDMLIAQTDNDFVDKNTLRSAEQSFDLSTDNRLSIKLTDF